MQRINYCSTFKCLCNAYYFYLLLTIYLYFRTRCTVTSFFISARDSVTMSIGFLLSFGSIFFPVPVYICFFAANKFDNYLLFVLPISILTISDTVAEWGGKRWGSFSRSFFQGQKTLAGSICFAVSCFFITLVMLAVIFRIPFGKSFLITASLSVIVTAVELVSLKGYDNLTVPISALALLILFLE